MERMDTGKGETEMECRGGRQKGREKKREGKGY